MRKKNRLLAIDLQMDNIKAMVEWYINAAVSWIHNTTYKLAINIFLNLQNGRDYYLVMIQCVVKFDSCSDGQIEFYKTRLRNDNVNPPWYADFACIVKPILLLDFCFYIPTGKRPNIEDLEFN